MKPLTLLLGCTTFALFATPSIHAAGEPPALGHNPFSRPSSDEKNNDPRILDSDAGAAPALALHATMVSSATRLANVAGRILKTGDTIEGYELLTIHEDFAVFRRDQKLMTVYVKPKSVKEDE